MPLFPGEIGRPVNKNAQYEGTRQITRLIKTNYLRIHTLVGVPSLLGIYIHYHLPLSYCYGRWIKSKDIYQKLLSYSNTIGHER